MSVNQHYHATIQKLKKRIHALEKQQKHGRKQLERAMNEARKAAKSYQSRLHAKIRQIKGKDAAAKVSSYTNAALDMERNLLRAAEKKAKALAAAVMEMDKQHISQLVQSFLGKLHVNGAVKKKSGKKSGKKSKRK
ncbi:MAG TPA: hypothetical protein VL360_08760 [Gammaproteobacteria bacterium]|jgi:hypothetical protein|nr:hypothetical protein [Gammaproteobacteria bacterium]